MSDHSEHSGNGNAGNGHRPAGQQDRAERVGLRALLHEYRPSVITGGASVAPLLAMAGLNAADELDRTAFGLLLPEIRDYFGVSLGTILTVASIAAVLPILLALPLGYVADRVKRTRMIAGGAAVWGVFSILTALASNLVALGVFRFGSGLGKTMEPAQQSLLADTYPPDRRSGAFAIHRLGNSIGLLIAPATAGVLASWFFWQVPFLVFGVPSLLLAVYTLLRVRDPSRGEQERRLLGIEGDALLEEETAPGWTESWRIAKGVRTLRRIWMALPFLVGSYFGVVALVSVYYDEEFGLSEVSRGILTSVDIAFGIVGLIVGGAIGNRMLARRPGRVITVAALVGILPAIAFLIIALSPWLALSVAAACVSEFAVAILGPTFVAVMTLTIPPRVRSFSLAAAALFIAPGVAVIPVAGWLADNYGIRSGIMLLVPVFLTGAAILGSAGTSVDADIRAATAASVAAHDTRRSRQEGKAKLLVCRDVDVHYGQVQILFNVDFEVDEGEIVALLGTNGAGKSTLLNAIAGVVTASNGAIYFEGEDVTHLPASEHVRGGIVTVPGGRGVFPSLTVRENLSLATWPLRHEPDETRAAIERVLDFFPILRERLDEAAGSLSGGEQQMLTLGQAFIARPKLLMIDELSLGLAPAIVEQLLGIVRAIHEAGTTIVLVEQSVNIALTVADRAVFMEKGEVRFSGPTAELLHRSDILRSVFLAGSGVGSSLARRARDRAPWEEEPEVVLDVRGITKSFGGVHALNGVDLVLRQGEILGLIGPNGAGKTTLFDAISGFVLPDLGTVKLVGDDVTNLSPDARARLGLQRSFQDARLFPALTVEENILVALDQHLAVRNAAFASLRLPNVNRAEQRLRKRAERLIMLLNLGPFRDKFVRELSTGTRRLVDLACVLGTDPQVLLLDEPSSGVAQRETEQLGPLILRIKVETGCSILLIEHDMPLISSVSDELVAMELGAVITRGKPDDVLAHPRVVEAYLGTSEEVIRRSGQLVGSNSQGASAPDPARGDT
jgi:branched-chain amino acid transport system ATP-binding protein